MKIALVGESPVNPSGFGQQMRMLAEGFQKAGHEVTCVSLAYSHAAKIPDIEEWRVADLLNLEAVDDNLYRLSPDVVICFWHTQGVSQFFKLKWPANNAKTFFWLPWEGSTLPKNADDIFGGEAARHVVHLSYYAKNLWREITPDSVVIPHGVSPQIFKPISDIDIPRHQSIAKLRRAVAEKLNAALFPDDLIILNVDRNIWHKRWDASFDFVAKLQKSTDRRVKLIAHTKKVEKAPTPIHGYNLPELQNAYGLDKSSVIYTDFDWNRGLSREDLVELFQIADFRISTSEGEGFGIPTVEAAMCECPQILNGVTNIPEITNYDKFGYQSTVKPAMAEASKDVLYQVPNVDAMVELALSRIPIAPEHTQSLSKLKSFAVKNYSDDTVVKKWLDLIDKTQLNESELNRKDGYMPVSERVYNDTSLAHVVSNLEHSPTVLEVGSSGSKFVESCLSLGLNATGLDWDDCYIDSYGKRVQPRIMRLEPIAEWPESKVVVITDFLSTLDRGTAQRVLAGSVNGSWLVLRNSATYLSNHKVLETGWVNAILDGYNCVRRHDMEKIVRSKWSKSFSHEIWQTSSGNEADLPEGFC